MNHPLVASAVELVNCGIEQRHEGKFPYQSPRFFHLASSLLGTEDKPFHLNRKNLGYRKDKRIAIAFSGGMLSWCATYLALKDGFDVTAVYLYSSSEYVRQNHYAGIDAVWVAKRLGFTNLTYTQEVVDVSLRGEFPGKSLVMASVCSNYAKRIWVPVTNDQVIKDYSSVFFREASQLFTEFYGQPYWVQSTVSHQTREELVAEYLSKGGELNDLALSVSCENLVEGKHCGTCFHCFRRYRTFQHFDYAVNFAVHPKDSPNYHNYLGGSR